MEGVSASEAARKLIGHGVEVQRQVEASFLRLPLLARPGEDEKVAS